jgi:hypothetical protein
MPKSPVRACRRCGSPLVWVRPRSGRSFWGCPNYPACHPATRRRATSSPTQPIVPTQGSISAPAPPPAPTPWPGWRAALLASWTGLSGTAQAAILVVVVIAALYVGAAALHGLAPSPVPPAAAPVYYPVPAYHQPGYTVICRDGWVSHSGGIQGACSHHGGVL